MLLISKALFVVKMFKFLSWIFLVMWENSLIRNLGLISKFMASQIGEQLQYKYFSTSQEISIIIQWNLVNLVKYNMRNTENVVRDLVPSTFFKNKNWSYPWINSLMFYTTCLYRIPKSKTLIFCMIFEKKYFRRCILLTNQI